jgi:hypothetical protein
MDRVLDCQFYRRFGVEIELNTLNGVIKKCDEENGEIPLGADLVACLVRRATRSCVEVHGWHATHNNDNWIVKPDSSCGIEVCSPILKGWTGLKSLMKVVEAVNGAGLSADNRCSMHVHVNISDLTKRQLAAVLAYYIKCEHVIMDSVPYRRKNNRYCEFIGSSDAFHVNFPMDSEEIIARVSTAKYYSVNAYHFMKGGGFTWKNNRKQTVEFRIGDNGMCLSPFDTKNWIRFLLHFVEVTKSLPLPKDYLAGDPWSSLLWLDPEDVFKVLKFNEPLSDGMKQVRDWFIDRISRHGEDFDKPVTSIWTNAGRLAAREQFLNIQKRHQKAADYGLPCDDHVFGKKYVI